MITSPFEALAFRTEWEEIVKDMKWDQKDGTIDNLRDFLESGHVNNRFRPNFDRAIEISKNILEYYDGTTRKL